MYSRVEMAVGELKPLIDSKIKDYEEQRWMDLTLTAIFNTAATSIRLSKAH